MGSNDLSLRVLLHAQDLASGKLKGFGSTLVNLAGDAGPLLKVFGGLSLAAVGVGVTAVQMAAPFQQAMLSLVAHAGLAKSQFNQVSEAVLTMAGDVGRSPTELTEAMYPILSSFSDIQNQSAKTSLALQTLKLSFETVAGTATDGTAVANTAVSVFHALGLATNNAGVNAKRMGNLFDLMDRSVQDGNMSWDAYRGTIGKVALAIQGTKISFVEANAALDVMTASGFPSARQAGVSLSNLLTEMVIKQDTVAKNAKKLGLAFKSQAFDSMNLAQRIAYLNKITHGNQAEILKLLSGSSAALKAFNSLSGNTQKYAANLKDLQHAHGALKASFDTAAQGLTFAWNRAKAAVDALFIRIGTALLPILTKLVSAVAPAVNWLLNFARAASQNEVFMALLKGALIAFAVVALAILIPAFIAWAIAAGSAAIATLAATWPLLLIILIVTLVVAAIILLWTHWKQVSQWIGDRLGELGRWFGDQFAKIGDFFSALGTKLHEKVQQIVAFFDGLRSGLGQKIQAVLTFFRDLPGQIGSFLASLPGKALQWGEDLINGFINGIKNAAGKLWQGIQDIGNGIKKFLGFSVPEAGPLSTADQWMPDMMHLMTQGIIAGNPKLQAAVHQTATVMAAGMTPPARSGATVPYGRPPVGNSYNSSTGGGNHYGDNSIVIQTSAGMSAEAVAQAVMQKLSRQYRSSGLAGNPARGMRDS